MHEKPDGRIELLTKGDNNRVDDRGLYAPGQQFIGREDILGRAGESSGHKLSGHKLSVHKPSGHNFSGHKRRGRPFGCLET